jgi:uncharacterized protein (TIGR00369 family)
VAGLNARLKAASEGTGEVPPIMSTLGMKLIHFGEGSATLALDVDGRFYNPMGTVHGGIMTDLADASMGIATITTLAEDESFSTLELKMNFLRPVFEGKITAQAKVLHRGKTIAMAECVVKNDHGKDVARGTATQIILGPEKQR